MGATGGGVGATPPPPPPVPVAVYNCRNYRQVIIWKHIEKYETIEKKLDEIGAYIGMSFESDFVVNNQLLQGSAAVSKAEEIVKKLSTCIKKLASQEQLETFFEDLRRIGQFVWEVPL